MGRNKSKIWRGISSTGAMFLALSVTASSVVSTHRTDIDKFLGTSSSRIVTDGNADVADLYTYQSDYADTTELVQAIADLGERMSEEGTVLLKNTNNALPLTEDETKKVSLLGFSSYYPQVGGVMSASLTPNVGTDADTVDFVQALEAKGYQLNDTLKELYLSDALKEIFKTEVETWTGTTTYYTLTAPAVGGVYSDKEPSQTELDGAEPGWKDSLAENNIMIVTIARAGSENADYEPGEAGVNPADGLNQTDPLGLSDDERDLINAAVEAKGTDGKVIVLLNTANAMEVQEIEDNEGVDAILQIGLPGGYGFYGVADVLSGDVTPSGHLSDTYAVKNANSPAAQNYGDLQWTNANPMLQINDAIVEAESIYAGYKYYETRYADCVLGQGQADAAVGTENGSWAYENEVTYPFGFGLSYTTFEQTLKKLDVDLENRTATVEVTVENTGDVAGKDVVQLYASVPYTKYDIEHGVEKSAVQLLDYAKTGLLEPGASETVTIDADLTYLASWDSTADNAAGTKGCYILDDGDYYFTIGNGAHEAVNNVLAAQDRGTANGMTEDGNPENVQVWTLDKFDDTTFAQTKNGTNVENQLEDMDINYWLPDTAVYLSRSNWKDTFPTTYRDLTATEDMLAILDNDVYEYQTDGDSGSVTWGADNGLSLGDLKGVTDTEDERWDQLIDQMQLSEALIRTAFGGTSTKTIESISSPEAVQNDGMNGIYSYPLGQYANKDKSSGDPCAIDPDDPNAGYKAGVMTGVGVVAQTWSKELAEEFGAEMGNFSLWSNLTIWWGVGVNLHRTPYNARNHDYYSEDPVLSTFQGAATIVGAQEYGVVAAAKHFAFNDTEMNRTGVAVFMTEQKAREGELRALQSCFEDAKALGCMTAYNRAGIYTDNSHTGLLKNILHEEWGFYGLMSEDFIMDPVYAALKEAVLNGVTMSCNTGENSLEAVAAYYPTLNWNEETVGKDVQMQEALKQAMKMQNYALANSNAMDGLVSGSHLENVRTWYDNLITAMEIVFAVITLLSLVMYFRKWKS